MPRVEIVDAKSGRTSVTSSTTPRANRAEMLHERRGDEFVPRSEFEAMSKE